MRVRTFWGLLFIAIGAVLLLTQLGVLPGNAWAYIWPLALITLGALVLIGAFRKSTIEWVHASVPLSGIETAHVSIKHGAGRLDVDADDDGEADTLVDGMFGGGIERIVAKVGHRADVTLKSPPIWLAPWDWFSLRDGLSWDVKLAPSVRLDLDVDTGASDSHLNLVNLNVRQLNLHTGASSVQVTLPAQAGHTRARVESGAASVKVYIPDGVAAHIKGHVGVGALDVDETRFPRRNGGYESPDFLTAPNRIEMEIEGGVGMVSVN